MSAEKEKKGMRFIETVGIGPVTEEFGRSPDKMGEIINERQAHVSAAKKAKKPTEDAKPDDAA